MSNPIQKVEVETIDKNTKSVNALFDSGSFYTIIRSDSMPATKFVFRYPEPEIFGTASKKSMLKIIGETSLIIEINNKRIRETVLLAPLLSTDLIIGAKAMQAWHITIDNSTGETKITVGIDMNDPNITRVI
ncbi:MAG: retroviral-like aspartic protease [Cytophagales bacterium]|nr:retroviral-like aspartic protease [Cytophagales bacterium]